MENGEQARAASGPARFGRRGLGPAASAPVPLEASAGFGRRAVEPEGSSAAARATRLDDAGRVAHLPTDDADAAHSAEDALAIFIGPNAEAYLRAYRLAEGSKALGRRLSGADRLWAGFFFPVPWLFYRKLYGHGSAALAATLVCALLGSSLVSAIVGIAISSLVMRYGKRLYIEHALSAVALADRRGLAGGERASYLRRSGGLSPLGLVVGVVLFVLPIAWMILVR
jgi:hypothetical protein